MEILYLLLAMWIQTTVFLALIWYIWTQQENMYWERDEMRQERKNLYDRLMAGTLPQYKEQQDTPNDVTDSSPDENLQDLEDAKEEISGVADNG